jgi:hypothetical protein
MAILIAGLLFLILVGLVSAFGYIHYVKPTRLLDQLATTTSDVIPLSVIERKRKRYFSLAQLLEPIGNLLPISSQDALQTKNELIGAGLRSRSAVPVYYGAKIVLAVVMVMLGLATCFRAWYWVVWRSVAGSRYASLFQTFWIFWWSAVRLDVVLISPWSTCAGS